MPRARRTRADPSSAHRYLHKARQFAEEAHESTDADHFRVVDLLREVGRDARGVDTKAQQLSALLGLKNRIEYEDKLARETDAATAIDRADRIVEWAVEQVRKIGI